MLTLLRKIKVRHVKLKNGYRINIRPKKQQKKGREDFMPKKRCLIQTHLKKIKNLSSAFEVKSLTKERLKDQR